MLAHAAVVVFISWCTCMDASALQALGSSQLFPAFSESVLNTLKAIAPNRLSFCTLVLRCSAAKARCSSTGTIHSRWH
jgi:hypothetical protein